MSQISADTEPEVLLLRPAPGVAEVRLNRPDKLNALTEDMYSGIREIFRDLHEASDVRAIILSGAGRGFCAGSDITAMGKNGGVAARARLQRRHATIQAVSYVEKPVIAAVQGPIAGIGFALAMACDFVVASQSAYFQQSFRNVGLVPDGGSIFFLAERLGTSRAKDLVMTCRRLGAAEAYDWGIVNRLVAEDELVDASLGLASELAAAPTYILGLTKKMFAATASPSLDTVLEIESYAAGVARTAFDHKEGIAAFKEKRAPKFTGE